MSLEDLFVEGIIKRYHGAGGFRLIVQPVLAIALGIRDGLQDAARGHPAYFIGLLFHPECRKEMFSTMLANLFKPFVLGVILDFILQYFIFHRAWLIPALLAGLLLIALPYSIARGLTNRIVSVKKRRS
jgi:hypothetical protein